MLELRHENVFFEMLFGHLRFGGGNRTPEVSFGAARGVRNIRNEVLMKVCGIVAEYNPFHLGHKYQIDYVRETLGADEVVVVMSGDFVQRGAPAVFSKSVRAEMALRCGADLVLELPAAVSTASAEAFAGGAVSLLDGLGVVDELCFGCESGNAGLFMDVAEILAEEPEAYRESLQRNLKQGMNFPAARAAALSEYIINHLELLPNVAKGIIQESALQTFLSSPNNILGLEYCKAILRQNSQIRPIPLKREGSGYHEEILSADCLPSASAIRRVLYEIKRAACKPDANAFAEDSLDNALSAKTLLKRAIPDVIYSLYKNAIFGGDFLFPEDFNVLLSYCLLRETPESLCRYAGISAELAQRIYRHRFEFRDFAQFGELLKTKETTRTRIDRALFHILLNIRETPSEVPYARVLGFRRESAPLLAEIKKNSRIPLITKPADAGQLLTSEAQVLFEETTFASNLYQTVLSQKNGQNFVHEYSRPLVIL